MTARHSMIVRCRYKVMLLIIVFVQVSVRTSTLFVMNIPSELLRSDLRPTDSYHALRKVYSEWFSYSRGFHFFTCFTVVISENIRSGAVTGESPPFAVLAFAVRNILRPTFLAQQIPALLALLANVEILRQRLQDAAQRIYDSPLMDTLSENEAAVVERIVQLNVTTPVRSTLRRIVNRLASLVSAVSIPCLFEC